MQQHGSQITVRSGYGETAFEFALPLADEAGEPGEGQAES